MKIFPRISIETSAARCTLVLVLLCLLVCDSLAADVLDIATTYKDGGGYDSSWKGTGVPQEIRFGGQRILAKGKGTYCCGFTFAVALDAARERGLLSEKTADEVRAFQKQWYGATEESREIQCALAVEILGIGKRIDPKEAMPGDFLQFWRTNKSGHSVVFLGWVEENGEQIGFKYRSSQGSTKGVGNQIEYFPGVAGKPGKVVRERMYFCRICERPQ